MLGLIDSVGNIIDKFIPDPKQAAEAKAQMNARIAEVDKAQAAINLQDAKSDKFIQYAWRPVLCWVGVLSVAWEYFFRGFINTVAENISSIYGYTFIPFEAVDSTIMLALLTKLLGFGVYRTYEKQKGVAGFFNKVKAQF